MTKGDIYDLIASHFEGDSRLFFRTSLKILKEFKEDGDTALVGRLDFILKSHAMIAPKRKETNSQPMNVSFDDAEKLGWTGDFVPMEEKHD